MQALGTKMEIYLKENNASAQELMDYLKTLNPSQVDFEFRKNFFGDQENIVKML